MGLVTMFHVPIGVPSLGTARVSCLDLSETCGSLSRSFRDTRDACRQKTYILRTDDPSPVMLLKLTWSAGTPENSCTQEKRERVKEERRSEQSGDSLTVSCARSKSNVIRRERSLLN